jgi:YHS domain-containing protein
VERMDRTAVVYICWSCGEDFEVTGHDGLADSLEVSCPTLTKEKALLSTELNGRTYLFCSERCRMLFSIRPAWFVDRTDETTRLTAS